MNTHQTSVTRLQPPANPKKSSKIQQVIHFPKAFAQIPKSTIGNDNVESSTSMAPSQQQQHRHRIAPDDISLTDATSHHLLPHIYTTILSNSEPYRLCDFYGVTVRKISLQSFEVIVRRRDDSRNWDSELYLEWHAELFNEWNFCTPVGTNSNSELTECEYTLMMPFRVLPSHTYGTSILDNQQHKLGVLLQAYSNSDVEFAVTLRHIDADQGLIICALSRTSGNSHEWMVPVRVFCRVFRLGMLDEKNRFLTGQIRIPPNKTSMSCVQQKVQFPMPFQQHMRMHPSPLAITFTVISSKIATEENDLPGLFCVSLKSITQTDFTILIKRIDGIEGWDHEVGVFWLAEATNFLIHGGMPESVNPLLYHPPVQNSGNPSYAAPLHESMLQQQPPSHGGVQAQSMYPSHSPSYSATAPSTAPPPSVSSAPSPVHAPVVPPTQQQQTMNPTGLPPPPAQKGASLPPPPSMSPSFHQQPSLTPAIPVIRNASDIYGAVTRSGSMVEKLRTLQAALQKLQSNYEYNDILSILPLFSGSTKDAVKIIINSGRLQMRGCDLPPLINMFSLENEKYEILQHLCQVSGNFKMSTNEARATLEQFHLELTRLDALECLASKISDAKKGGKSLVALFNDKERQKRAKKALNLKRFGLF